MAGFFDDTEETTSPVAKSFFDDTEEINAPAPERTLGSTLKDTGISLAKGVIGAGQGIVGLADIPTGGRVGRGLEYIGIKPEEWQADLSEEYSLAQQEANKKVDAAKGFVDTAQAMLENPSTIAHGIVETLPSVAAGGVLGRGALALSSKLLPKAVTALGKTGSAIAAGSVGEGAISAGQTAEQIRNETPDDLLTPEQSALAVASGLGTSAFGIVGGSLAKKLGFADIDTMVVSGLNPAKKEGFKGVVKSIVGGGITEGVFEELPQTVQETIFTNAALDKPLLEGVPEGAAQAIILGGVMGAGANLLPGVNKPAEKTEQELELDRQAANILNLKEDELGKSIQKLTTDINSNQELINDLDKLEAKARKENIDPAELIRKTIEDNKNNQSLLDRINSGIQKKEELVKKEYEALSPEEKQAKEIENKLAEKRIADAQKINDDLDIINKREEIALKQYKDETDPDKKASIADRIFNLKKEKNTLLDRQLQQKTNQTSEFSDPKKADEIRQEKENFYNSLWLGGVNKDATESAQVFGEKSTEQQDILDRLSTQIANTQNEQKKQELQKVYDGLFQTFERDASESAETIANADLSQFDQLVKAKDQERLNSVLESIVVEHDPQARQTLYEKMFMQPGVKDAAESAEVFATQGEDAIANQRKQELQKVMSSITQESDPVIRQKLYNQMFEQLGVKNAQESAEVFLTQKFTEREKAVIEDYWEEVKKELNLRNEKMTPGTEAFMRKKFFETQLAEIEKDVQQEAKVQGEAKQNVVPSLAEQNKRQIRFRQIAESLGDIRQSNAQAVQTEIPRNLPGGLQNSFTNEQQVAGAPQFQVNENQEALGKVNLDDIKKAFPGQEITQSPDGIISIKFKNGQGVIINSIQNAGQGFVKLAIETGQMSKNGKILGITVGNEILLDQNFADNKTLWHENKHVLDNLGIVTEADDSSLNREFNKLRKLNKLDFALSTHKDPKQRMVENRANMFAQIMVNRADYRNTAFGKVIQRVMDFFQQMLSFGKQTVSGLAREVESGKIYERKVNGETVQVNVPQAEATAKQWYSALENAVSGFQQKQATPDQWKGMIKNFPGIKQDELDWVGVNDWLDKQEGKVTQADLLKFVKENNVQLEEVVKGEVDNDILYGFLGELDEKLSPYNYTAKFLDGELVLSSSNGLIINSDNINKLQVSNEVKNIFNEANNNMPEVLDEAKYSGYQLIGGKNYKEILLTLPEKQNIWNEEYKKLWQKMEEKYGTKDYFELEKKLTKEDNAKLDSLDKKANEFTKNNYQSNHWDEKNILAHIRFNERTDAEGNKVLFLEEIQSDWHQEGKKQGYQGKPLTQDERQEWYNLESLPEAVRTPEQQERLNELDSLKGMQGQVPNAPFKNSTQWSLLAMKRMVRYAAENGFDKIAWTTGQQQADRYGLSKSFDKIEAFTNSDGTVNIFGYKDGQRIVDRQDIQKEELPNIVGQDLTNKIINQPWVRGEYSGLDLQVGGEGMKAFYDKILPNTFNAEFNKNKWGNARVEVVNIGEKKISYTLLANGEDFLGFDTLKEAEEDLDHFSKKNPDKTFSIREDNNTTQQLSIPITNRMKSKALREGMPMFEVRETPVQKISDDVYHQMFTERNSLVRTIGQTLRMRGHEIKQLIDKGLGSISTRLKNVDPMLRAEIRNLDFWTAQKIVTALRIAHPLLEKTKQMSPQDKFIWDASRRNSDEVKIKELAAKYNMTADQEKLRSVLDQIRQDAIDVGYDVGFIEEYWPRIIKDQEGFLQATKGISQRPVITDAIKVYADKLGMTVEKFEIEYPEQAADIASNTILGRNLGIGGPGNIQARQYETVPPELNKFYMDSDAALMQYIYSMTKKIEARKFFGKVPERIATLKAEKKRKQVMLTEYEKSNNAARIEDVSGDLIRIEQELDKYKLQRDYTENIGTYINDLRMSGRIQADDEKVVRDILDARFHEHGATGIVNAYKNMSYIDVMGSPISALTQIGDLAWAMYVGKVWTPRGLADTIKNVGKAITKKSEITKEDLGIERIAQEFADGTTLGNAVSWVFKKVQLERIDSIGKETLINNAFSNYKTMASIADGRQTLLKQIKPIFGTQSESVINDLLANNPTDNVKMLLYHRLLDFQPVALSEMSEQYLKSGNGRVFYMLKTYTLKQFDVFRNEAWHKIKSGERDQVIEGIGNMIKLVSLLTLANAGADELKDLLLGKETKFEDHVIENFLTMGGASKFVRMQTTREGLGSGLMGQILPPFRFVNSISKDLNQLYGAYITGDTIDFDHSRIVESIPIGGKIYYWHYGRGEDYKKSSNEQEFGKVSKEVDVFKKQLENSEDKRTFLNSNLDGFKQMKLHENFQSALNRNQAVINKLKKIDQTTNVRERLGQLQQQREVILKRYFDVTGTVQ